jgi:hypothetical protein
MPAAAAAALPAAQLQQQHLCTPEASISKRPRLQHQALPALDMTHYKSAAFAVPM